jgi:general secretion pathway protein M
MNFAAWIPEGRFRRALAAASFGLVVVGLWVWAGWIALGLYDESTDVATLRERLSGLDQRLSGGTRTPGSQVAESGSPFLEGATVTLAGAALQQRMERAVTRAGGELLSSQVELESPSGEPGFLSLAADVDLPGPALQAFLYDIEAGMPYLFVDTLAVQSPAAAEGEKSGRLHVALGVSGKWEAKR